MKPQVGIIMGSDSDLRVMQAAADVLESFGVTYELRVVSAHRTPRWMAQYASDAEKRGLQVIIAGAGGAAHLPGMVASLTHLPVIGIPVIVGQLNGIDALLSIAQMPKGIPVATMAVENAANGALFAVRILARTDRKLATKLRAFHKTQTSKIRTIDRQMQKDKR